MPTAGQRVVGALRWGISLVASVVGGAFMVVWSAIAPWLGLGRPRPQRIQAVRHARDCRNDENKTAACCLMDFSAHRKDSFEEAERQIHLTVTRSRSIPRSETKTSARSTPSPTPRLCREILPPGPLQKKGVLVPRQRPPEARHMKATNL